MKPPKVLFVFLLIGVMRAPAQISRFEHIVILFQENRTPDNLFQGLCGADRSLCPSPYNLQDFGINSHGQKIPLTPVSLGVGYDLNHSHGSFVAMCDLDPTINQCKMDGADKVMCGQVCPPNPQFQYVQSSDVDPYLTLARQYGWANFMFQTNQGPSAPAHQFIFSGTSAPDATSDMDAIFVAENPNGRGCLSALDTVYPMISPQTAPKWFNLINRPLGTVCFSRPTMASLLEAKHFTWRYYTPGGSNFTAPVWIREICVPDSTYTTCTGDGWKNNVSGPPQNVLKDIAACNLANVVWVNPTGPNSDHAGNSTFTGGPSWVASIVNAIGMSTCDSGRGYWNNTAILITWDDWGGWYDHVRPPLLSVPQQGQGDYQLGFRVPLVVVSAYTPAGYVNNNRQDFGSILRFTERNFGIPQGALNFADKRAANNLGQFFRLTLPPRPFEVIAAPLDAEFFVNDDRPMEPPDND